MVKKSSLFSILLLVTIMFTVVVDYSWAADDLQQKINLTKRKLSQTKVKETSVLRKLVSSQKELDRIGTNLNQLSSRMGNTEKRIGQVKDQLNQAESDLNAVHDEIFDQQGVLNRRLVAIYKYGYQSYLEILFHAKNFGEFVTRFELIGNFVNSDINLLQTLEQQLELIAKKKEEIAYKRAELEREKNVYSKLHSQTRIQQSQKLSLVSIQRKELESIQRDRRKLEAALDEMERTSKAMESQIRNYQIKNRDKLGTGTMIWPVHGRISSYFGYRMHPILKKTKYHSGLDIAAPSGTPILAADNGLVIFSSTNGGYGKMITIDHGAGLSTVYGHCSVLLVNSGERVSKGQRIALVGSTGLSTGPHLHFEVRKEGRPTDPTSYL